MMRRSLIALACVALSPALAAAAPPPEALGARLLGPTPLLDDLAHLTDGIGGRPTGSPALEAAVDWALTSLRTAGVDSARTESYVPPRNWLARAETAEALVTASADAGAERTSLRVAAMPFSPATAAGGLAAEVVDVGHGTPAEIRAVGARAKGRWLLVRTAPMRTLDDLLTEYFVTPPVFTAAKTAGAAGVLWESNRPGRLLYRHNVTLDGSLAPVPGVLVEREASQRIGRQLATGRTVTVHATIDVAVAEKPTDRNVIAEIRGREKPDEVIVLGAHLDSWDLGRGALDNGCNVALVIDVARQLAALAAAGQRPRRTIRFVLYTGEELALYGSWFDVRAHRAELDRTKAVVIYDEGTGRTTGFSLGGRADLAAATTRALAPVASLGPFTHTTDAEIGTDNFDYLLEGIPTLVANQDGPPYLPDYHAESDTLDKVDVRELKLNAVIAATLTWGLADDVAPPAPRQTRAEVMGLVQATGLDAQLKVFGLWDDFVAGRRGRAK